MDAIGRPWPHAARDLQHSNAGGERRHLVARQSGLRRRVCPITGHRPQRTTTARRRQHQRLHQRRAGSAGGVNLGADAIQEFSVMASNYTAEYGRTSGGVINAITPVGDECVSWIGVRVLPPQLSRYDTSSTRRTTCRSRRSANQFGGFRRRAHRPEQDVHLSGDYERHPRPYTRRDDVANVAVPRGATRTALDRRGVRRSGNRPVLDFWPLPMDR